MSKELLSLLGIARRAGKLSLGHDAVVDAVRKESARLIIFAQDLSQNTVEDIRRQAQLVKIQTITILESVESVGLAIGKRVGVIAVNDDGFAEKMVLLYRRESAVEETTNRRDE